MPESFEELAALIRTRFAELSPQFQAGAAFLLDRPDEVAVLSMRKVADHAQVQPASLVRLAQQLGFPGWNELRDLFVARLRTRPEPLTSRARSLVSGARKDTLAHDLLAAHRHNLEVTAAQNERAIVDAARTLRRARHIYVAGFRSCYPVAFGLVYGYGLFRSTITLLTGEAGTLEMQLRGIERGGATVVISFAPYSIEAARVAEAALEKGSRLIAITDSAVSPIALNADHALIFSHESPSFFPSLVAAAAVAEALVAHLLALEGSQAVEQLEEAERSLHEKGAYVP
ncbi:MurR/RpiR family transcriptional regulator [Trinickia caryophylli]|uniref:Transcriptional regulator, RpiR family n=1 Tax=Trinickia caryophylli TaxID=28094 RepID=A0A1X7FNG9_TRICW|nr:MurR/RpiR family transcriptional regulator [Trinickia caryophylli]PMS13887.1 MurR/RpiR family transcriptional regulator [Trinickia caryophylli]TRX14383.1 MurR/RpiR family transcriptional regulator [Trinickia caryophylli]WQE14220.1 MurR/RpiR family transcriptional regulator [Trinickia caryophylli]SMF55707.1 transcriptional regulator, RpiR family [Trinickia caryophylli]GLU33273.1 DNA-binding protein [Trinickia caryophylli]